MCRLYGFRATHATRIGCHLVSAQNAILCQSRRDSLGRCHGDGWGIAYYRGRVPCLKKRAAAAFEDLRFSDAARDIASRTVLAHVRLATVGRRTERNTHPFRRNPFVFAHNGTLSGIDLSHAGRLTLREQLQRELVDAAVTEAEPIGQTDSELIFRWILSRLYYSGQASRDGFADATVASGIVATAVRELDERSRETGAKAPAKLNLLISDGATLIATRLRNDLFMIERDRIEPCFVCGETHATVGPDQRYRAIAFASEPLTTEPWQPVPESTMVVTDGHFQTFRAAM